GHAESLIPGNHYGRSDTIQVINNFAIANSHLAFKFPVAFYPETGIIPEAKLPFTYVQQRNIGNRSDRQVSKLLAFDHLCRCPGRSFYDGWNIHPHLEELRHHA